MRKLLRLEHTKLLSDRSNKLLVKVAPSSGTDIGTSKLRNLPVDVLPFVLQDLEVFLDDRGVQLPVLRSQHRAKELQKSGNSTVREDDILPLILPLYREQGLQDV